MPKVRWIGFYPDDWIAGTVGMSLEEEGLYIRLCSLIYAAGGRGLPIPKLAQMCKIRPQVMQRLLPGILAKFEERDDGTLSQHRCDEELARADDRSETARINADKRWKNNDTADATASDTPNQPKSARKTPNPNQTPAKLGVLSRFAIANPLKSPNTPHAKRIDKKVSILPTTCAEAARACNASGLAHGLAPMKAPPDPTEKWQADMTAYIVERFSAPEATALITAWLEQEPQAIEAINALDVARRASLRASE